MIERIKYYYGRCKDRLNEHHVLSCVKRDCLRDDTVLLLGTPIHGNLGDQAITLAELEFFNNCGYRVAEIPSQWVVRHLEKWKTLFSGKRLYVHGGGFIGSLWPEEEKMLETVIENFPESEIVILPQTVYFDKVDDRVTSLNELLGKHGRVTLCARENYSFEFAVQYLNNANVLLVPDMVLSADWSNGRVQSRETALFCMRSDLEKTISKDTVATLESLVKTHFPSAKIVYTDTTVDKMVYPAERKKALKRKLAEFASAQVVVTDRLHGMVLSAMTDTPTLVFSNCNYKVKGIYDWISGNSFIQYCDNPANAEQQISVLETCHECHYSHDEAIKAFKPLTEIVGKYHG